MCIRDRGGNANAESSENGAGEDEAIGWIARVDDSGERCQLFYVHADHSLGSMRHLTVFEPGPNVG